MTGNQEARAALGARVSKSGRFSDLAQGLGGRKGNFPLTKIMACFNIEVTTILGLTLFSCQC